MNLQGKLTTVKNENVFMGEINDYLPIPIENYYSFTLIIHTLTVRT